MTATSKRLYYVVDDEQVITKDVMALEESAEMLKIEALPTFKRWALEDEPATLQLFTRGGVI